MCFLFPKTASSTPNNNLTTEDVVNFVLADQDSYIEAFSSDSDERFFDTCDKYLTGGSS